MCFFTVIAGIQAHKKQGVFPVQTYLRQTVYPDTQSTPSQRITVIWIENSLAGRKYESSKGFCANASVKDSMGGSSPTTAS